MPDGMLKPGWLPPELCTQAHQGDPRMDVLSVVRLEYHQISLIKLPNMTVESRYRSRIGRSQSGCRPGGTTCLPQKPKRRQVRAKTHASPLDHRLWLEDWPGSTEGRRGQNW